LARVQKSERAAVGAAGEGLAEFDGAPEVCAEVVGDEALADPAVPFAGAGVVFGVAADVEFALLLVAAPDVELELPAADEFALLFLLLAADELALPGFDLEFELAEFVAELSRGDAEFLFAMAG
jgi:hypothetical protein